MKTTWLLVANASEARLFTIEDKHRLFNGKETLKLIKEYNHPASRKKDIELTSDRLGHFEAKGSGTGSFVEASDPKKFEADTFAKDLANDLENGRVTNHYQDLILIASPEFYGMINKHLNNHIENMVSTHITKDYTKEKERELTEILQNYLEK